MFLKFFVFFKWSTGRVESILKSQINRKQHLNVFYFLLILFIQIVFIVQSLQSTKGDLKICWHFFFFLGLRWSGWKTRRWLTLPMTETSTSPSTTIWSSNRRASPTRPTTRAWPRTSWPSDAVPLPRSSSTVRRSLIYMLSKMLASRGWKRIAKKRNVSGLLLYFGKLERNCFTAIGLNISARIPCHRRSGKHF